MFLSKWLLSQHNRGLTLDAVKMVLANSTRLTPGELAEIKFEANHPLLSDDSLFDEIPNEVRGLFVMEPYFPRKLFNSAFASLFGKDRIEDIDVDSFYTYKRLREKHPGYTLTHVWRHLPFTKEEHNHLQETFRDVIGSDLDPELRACQFGLMEQRHIDIRMYSFDRVKFKGPTSLSFNVSSDIANFVFDKKYEEFDRFCDAIGDTKKVSRIMDGLRDALRFSNLSTSRREKLVSKFGLNELGVKNIYRVYNDKIPDEVFKHLLSSGMINESSIKDTLELICDLRIPLEDATRFSLQSPASLALRYFTRSDLTEDLRMQMLGALLKEQQHDDEEYRFAAIRAISGLLTGGHLTLPEVVAIEGKLDETDARVSLFRWSQKTGIPLPVTVQDKWTEDGFITDGQFQMFHDAAKLVKLIKEFYIDGVCNGTFRTPVPSDFLLNKGLTTELLFDLVKICRQPPANESAQKQLDELCDQVLYKMAAEGFYPPLVGNGNGTGIHGRPEKILAHMLNGDAGVPSQFDLDFIVEADLQLDYSDADVCLTSSLARNPELNEEIAARRLKWKLEHMQDAPAPLLTRQRPSI
ncbi:hypothetical protein ACK32R_04885 [Aeromonas dhakensis]|uniref:hypothetical protein n=1 Tax=Aeromonas dhakensis TaxID=196024 RepID=UPI003986B2F5